MSDFQIINKEKPEWGLIGGGISEYNRQQTGESGGQSICIVLQGPDGEALGGLIGETHWGWFYINLMWIPEELRHRGYGGQILAMAEEEAINLGASQAYLDTFTFQAPDFYRKHGYQVFGELSDFPPGHTRFYMVKPLI